MKTPLHAQRAAPWHPPARGTPIIIASDLGLGGPPMSRDRAQPSEWILFADRASAAGCPVVVLSPFDRGLVPRYIAAVLRCVRWDRSTTARGALR
jgi:hypothetical protein